MRALLTYLFLLTLSIPYSFSQQAVQDTSVAEGAPLGEYRVNFAIPNSPAFNILNVYPSNILRPSNTKEISVIASGFRNSGNLIIPNSFALEIAPWLLLSSRKSLSDYQKSAWKRLLYNTSVSIASQRNDLEAASTTASDLAAGLRVSIAGKGGDIKKETEFLAQYVFAPKEKLMAKRDSLLKVFIKEKNINKPFEDSDTVIKKEFEQFLKEKYYQANEDKVNADIRQAIGRYKIENWNHSSTDIAIAWRGFSEDSLLENTKSHNVYLWFTQAIRLQKWGQLLIGLNYQLQSLQSDTSFSNIIIPARLYAGTNRIKGFLELQYEYDGNLEESAYLANFGSELNILDGLWAVINAGAEKKGNRPVQFVSNFSIRFTLPERFNLF